MKEILLEFWSGPKVNAGGTNEQIRIIKPSEGIDMKKILLEY